MNRFSPAWPVLVGTLADERHLEELGSRPPAAGQRPDWFELRLDALARGPWTRLPAACPPLLVTARDPREGGHGGLDLAVRLRLLEESLPHAVALDLEWANFPHAEDLLAAAAERGVLRVASAHDFLGTPAAAELRRLVETVAASPRRPDLFKLACRLHGPADLARLFELLDSPPLPLAVMGMGPLGPAARVALTAAGSRLLYGYQVEANAPGQSSVAALRACENLWRTTPA